MDKKAAISLFSEKLRKFYYETGIYSAVTNFKIDCRIGGVDVHVEENGNTINVPGKINDNQEVPLSIVMHLKDICGIQNIV